MINSNIQDSNPHPQTVKDEVDTMDQMKEWESITSRVIREDIEQEARYAALPRLSIEAFITLLETCPQGSMNGEHIQTERRPPILFLAERLTGVSYHRWFGRYDPAREIGLSVEDAKAIRLATDFHMWQGQIRSAMKTALRIPIDTFRELCYS